jgi:hypothetical protein
MAWSTLGVVGPVSSPALLALRESTFDRSLPHTAQKQHVPQFPATTSCPESQPGRRDRYLCSP